MMGKFAVGFSFLGGRGGIAVLDSELILIGK